MPYAIPSAKTNGIALGKNTMKIRATKAWKPPLANTKTLRRRGRSEREQPTSPNGKGAARKTRKHKEGNLGGFVRPDKVHEEVGRARWTAVVATDKKERD